MIERAAIKTPCDVIPTYSQYGYVIDEKGDVYALTARFMHGFILSLLYPQALEDFRKTDRGTELEDRLSVSFLQTDPLASITDVDVYAFQAFELASHGKLPAIRVCGTRLMGPPICDLPDRCTLPQVTALRHVFRAMNATSNTKIETDLRESTVIKVLTDAMKRAEPNAEDA